MRATVRQRLLASSRSPGSNRPTRPYEGRRAPLPDRANTAEQHERPEAKAGIEPGALRTRFAGGQLHQEPHQGHARPRTDSNRRPPDPESGALSAELRGRGAGGGNRTHSAMHLLYRQARLSNVGAPTGASDRLRSGFSGATTRRSPIELQTQYPAAGSNRGPPRCERGALPLS
jgi:hypothetical protein